ncbi:hypothetical protein GCM10023231_23670 [Olivibacter ginsenosidimutans]|uniref:Uncharacterized protein n=1 Tax=Olivibacter ginsenosidimutans TaxID=1176537 RepID=A0ABP9BEX9_9SPHI
MKQLRNILKSVFYIFGLPSLNARIKVTIPKVKKLTIIGDTESFMYILMTEPRPEPIKKKKVP